MCIHAAKGKGEKKPRWREADPGLKAGRADDSAAGKGQGGPNLQIGGNRQKKLKKLRKAHKQVATSATKRQGAKWGSKEEDEGF